MKLARYEVDGKIRLGEVRGEVVRDVLAGDSNSPELVLRHIAGEREEGAERTLQSVRLLAPIGRPRKIVCIGLNYLDHCRETGQAPPTSPVVFSKFDNAVCGPGDEVVVSRSDTEQVDWEVEMVAVIGRECRRVTEAEALGYLAGYTVGNDVSARDVQFENGQWVRGKSFDGFLPLGPWLVTTDEIPDPQTLGLRTWVGDDLMQDGHTSEMIFPVAQLISFLSRTITLAPGDIVATGTPWGVGFVQKPPRYLNEGERVTVEIDGIGRIENHLRFTP
ncbi:MAG: fumarylacetoacetate hydrolase family protein [Candidatus Dormibacteria bacterium]